MTARFAAQDAAFPAPQPFRGDIAGLRGLAVLSLVLFHYGLPPQGGFAAIDSLFVLSGFLIGGALWREYETTLEIRPNRLFVRRLLSLAPPLLIVLAVVTVLGWVVMLPDAFRLWGLSVTAVALQVSNLLFWFGGSYFDQLAEPEPLLHLWSLATGVQSVAVTALVFILMRRNPHAILLCLALLCVASFAACIAMTSVSPEAAFFLLPFRLWEFLSGTLLAIWGCRNGRDWRGYAPLSWAGALLLGSGLILIPPGTPFYPGLLATIPVTGTLLLLANGTGRNAVNAALAHPLAMTLGAMSLTLFLWHWPVLVLARMIYGADIGLPMRLGLLILSISLAWGSTRLSRWFRRSGQNRMRRAAPAFVLMLTASAAVLGLWVSLGDGYPGRFGAETRGHLAALQKDDYASRRCAPAQSGLLLGLDVCQIGPDGPPKALIWGDDSLETIASGLDRLADQADMPGILLWRAGCPPLFGVRKSETSRSQAKDTDCTQANKQIRQALGRLPGIDRVLLVGRWAYYASGRGIGLDAERTVALHRVVNMSARHDQLAVAHRAARDTAALLRSRVGRVFVLRQPPEIPLYDAGKAAREAAFAAFPMVSSEHRQMSVSRDALALRSALADALWLPLVEAGDLSWIDPWPKLCNADTCFALHDGQSDYRDNARLSPAAIQRLAPLFGDFLAVERDATLMSAADP